MRYTKIVCTIGPASHSPDVLRELIDSGMDVARINFSHGDHTSHSEAIGHIRALAAELDRPIAILGDLQGPKLRVGHLPAAGIVLRGGKQVKLTVDPSVTDAIPLQYHDLPRLVTAGDRILLDDGLLELEVIGATATTIAAEVITGGTLHANKGINLPRADASIPAITEKDIEDLRFALAQQLDWIALSFVRTPEEVAELRGLIRRWGQPGQLPQIIAKIEKPEAVANIEAIIQACDGIMVARGDLGIELPTEDVPMVQKQIITLCNQAGRPVITATQMLDSMMRNPRPTRAEATDVANAVLDGADAVMLSGETAAGKYPVQAVQVMARIVSRAEGDISPRRTRPHISAKMHFVAQAIAHAASELAADLGAAAIIAPTTSGYTARQLSRYRPGIPIVAVTPNPMVQRQLNLHWSVFPLLSQRRATTDEVINDAVQAAVGHGLVKEGDIVVITAGSASSTPGATDLIKVHLIERILARGKGMGGENARAGCVNSTHPRPPI